MSEPMSEPMSERVNDAIASRPGGSWKTEIPSWIVLALMYGAAALAWGQSPDRIPVHWNQYGQANGWGGRFQGLLLIPLVATGLYLLLRFLPRLGCESRRSAFPSSRSTAALFPCWCGRTLMAPG
jgi:uncharacterized membrane protein